MSPSTDELRRFHQFIADKLGDAATWLSPEEALDLWRADHPISEDLEESVTTVRQALADMAAGDIGRPSEDVLADLRARHGIETT